MTASAIPPCGLYRTKQTLGDIPAGRLVYFHNHGEPGPGVYLPRRWIDNQADFERNGYTLPHPVERYAAMLESLPDEGFYRVTEQFYCCEKRCRRFDADLLVQLGYNADGEPILFVPELCAGGIAVPGNGSGIEFEDLNRLAAVRVMDPPLEEPAKDGQFAAPTSNMLH